MMTKSTIPTADTRSGLFFCAASLTAMLTAANGNYDYLYLGLAKDAPDDEAAWIAGAPDASGADGPDFGPDFGVYFRRDTLSGLLPMSRKITNFVPKI